MMRDTHDKSLKIKTSPDFDAFKDDDENTDDEDDDDDDGDLRDVLLCQLINPSEDEGELADGLQHSLIFPLQSLSLMLQIR